MSCGFIPYTCFFQCNDLVVEDELKVFHCVDLWLRGRREAMERAGEDHIDLHIDRFVQALLPHIRDGTGLQEVLFFFICRDYSFVLFYVIFPN